MKRLGFLNYLRRVCALRQLAETSIISGWYYSISLERIWSLTKRFSSSSVLSSIDRGECSLPCSSTKTIPNFYCSKTIANILMGYPYLRLTPLLSWLLNFWQQDSIIYLLPSRVKSSLTYSIKAGRKWSVSIRTSTCFRNRFHVSPEDCEFKSK